MADGVGLAGATGPDIAAATAIHARLLRDRGLQFDFPSARPPTLPQWPAWLEALARSLGEFLRVAGPFMTTVFWVGVGAAVLLALWLILREVLGVRFARRRRARAARPAPADWRPDRRRARALLENADRLAAQGRFDQATRLILHRSIEDIEERRPRLVRPALTARDIAGLDDVPARARSSFAAMAAIVEFGAFAGQPIGQGAFAQCRAAYEAFAFPEAWA